MNERVEVLPVSDEDCLARAGHEWVILKGTKLPARAEKDLVTKADALRGIAMMRRHFEARLSSQSLPVEVREALAPFASWPDHPDFKDDDFDLIGWGLAPIHFRAAKAVFETLASPQLPRDEMREARLQLLHDEIIPTLSAIKATIVAGDFDDDAGQHFKAMIEGIFVKNAALKAEPGGGEK